MTGPRRTLPQVAVASPPPFRLPAEHFIAALIWLAVLAAALPVLAPRLARGELFAPAVFALVHVAVLGVLATTIFGALLQFVPGGLEVPLRSVRLGHIGFWSLQAGVVSLVAGFWVWHGWLQLAGWILVFVAVGAVSINVLPARRRSTHGKLVGLYLSVAHSALGLGMAVGLVRIGATLGWWSVDRLGLLAAHLQLGVVGFGTLTAVGVGSRMVPTFLLAQGDDGFRLRLTLALATTGLVLFPLGAGFGWPGPTWAGAAALGLAGVAILELAARWFARKNRRLDPALRQIAAAFIGLAATLGWGIALATDPGNLRRWAAYLAAATLGWLLMLVVGVLAKLLTHLSYINLFRTMPGFARIGNPNLLLHPGWINVALVLLALGAGGLPVAIERGHQGAALATAAVWSAGAVLTLANYIRMMLRGRQ